MTGGLVFALCGIVLTGVAQTILKWATGRKGKIKGVIGDYVNVPVVGAYVIFVVVTVLGVLALREMDLKVYYALTGLNFVVVVGFSGVFLGEIVNRRKIIAIIIIISGILFFNI